MSRALSVHQGKGATPAEAQLGALLEGVESHAAETYPAQGLCCPFEQLPEKQRAPALADFAAHRDRPPLLDEAVEWIEAEDWFSGRPLHLPFELVSLDFTRNIPSLFDRASNGIATGATRDDAIAAALQELIERDAVTEWKESDLLEVMESTLNPRTISFDWFHLWRERVEAAGAMMLCYHVPSVTGSPVFACEINDLRKDGRAYRAIQGRGCHPNPEIALFKAVAEAIQGRAAYISGARDDLLPGDYTGAEKAITIAFGLPMPPSMDGVDINSVASGPSGPVELADALHRAGYGRIGIVDLANPSGLNVVRAFVCGLGSMSRRRRPPS